MLIEILKVFESTYQAINTTIIIYSLHLRMMSFFPVQAVSIAGGLPYTVVLCVMCVAMWRYLKAESRQGINKLPPPEFSKQILDTYQKLSNLPKLGLCLVAPWYFIGRAGMRLNKYSIYRTVYTMVIIALLFYSSIVLMALKVLEPNLLFIGLSVYIVFAVWCCRIRSQMRDAYGIDGKSNSKYL